MACQVISIFGSREVHVRDEHRPELLTRPERPRLQNGWLRQFLQFTGDHRIRHPHEQLESKLLVDESVSRSHLHSAKQRVLHDTHARLVRLRRDYLTRHSHNLLDFS